MTDTDDEITETFWIPIEDILNKTISFDPFTRVNDLWLRPLRARLKSQGCSSAVRRRALGVEITITGPVNAVLDVVPEMVRMAKGMAALGLIATSDRENAIDELDKMQEKKRREHLASAIDEAVRESAKEEKP